MDHGAASRPDDIVWRPAADAWETSRLGEFARFAVDRPDRAAPSDRILGDYDALLAWSLAEPGDFWSALAAWADVAWHDRPTDALASRQMPGALWFPGGTLNYAEQMLRHAGEDPKGIAVVERSQTRERREVTWTELVDQVGRCRDGLVRLGVGRGDRVVAYSPNIGETLVAFLATASLGAVWSSCAPEFGVRAVTDRWSQIEPIVLIAIDGYRFGDRRIDRADHVAEIVGGLPTLEHVVHVPYLAPDGAPVDDLRDRERPTSISWDEFVAADPGADRDGAERDGAERVDEIPFVPVPFDHPLYVLFSSGTTGLPKPIVHGHGGITLEHLKSMALHSDMRPGERFFWFTTTGWMMWNLCISSLLTGSTVVLFDGDPASPDLGELWRIGAEEEVDLFGVSAPFLMACRKAGIRPGDDLDLGGIRHVGSTGAPLPAAGFHWVADAIGPHVQVGSLSGGTDVCAGFVGPAPVLPVRAGRISARMLACDIQAFRPDGEPCPTGTTGELVITTPLPSMPVGLWDDDSGHRLAATYFSTFPGVWHHGDWITFEDDGSCEITGRSDATLNRGGVRLGTSDFYTVVESLSEVADSLVVHLEDRDGGAGELILLVVTTPDAGGLDDDLRASIGRALRSELSPRHVPDVIEEVDVVPRTLSGKKLEVPVKRMLLGAEPDQVASRDSLQDPGSLDAVAEWMATRGRPPSG
jgi:acetoacetyl-CoA synthetase